MFLTRLAITRPIVIWMALIAIAILGVLSYTRLPAELNPRVDIPTLTVITIYPGAGPQEIETMVTKPLEDAVRTVSDMKDVFSSSQESYSIVSMDFEVGTDIDRALNSVREKVDAARLALPQDVRPPVVAKLDINAQPILYIGLAGEMPIRKLRQTVDDDVKPLISRVPGVAAVNVSGGEEREIRVAVDARRLEQNALTISDVVNSIQAANHDVPAGSIVQGRRDISVRALAALGAKEQIEDTQVLAQQLMMQDITSLIPPGLGLPLPKPKPRAPLTIGDLATVTDTVAPAKTLSRVNGRDCIGVVITKSSDANTVAVVRGVQDVLKGLKPSTLQGITTTTLRDESLVVGDALEDVNVSLILGAVLAMFVIGVFLRNLRGTFIVSLALPACMVATFLVMYFAGFTLNQMTLLALSLSVGILVDDSIVVLESITRHLGMGERPEEAAFNGRTEIGFASMTLTLADVVVFLPIAFMGGIVGAFFRQFGLTIVAATLFSLIVSFTVTPSLAARWYKQRQPGEVDRAHAWPLMERVEAAYRRLLLWALARRGWVIAWAFVAVVCAVLVSLPSLGFELLPATDQGQITIMAEAPSDSSLAATDAVMREVERRLGGVRDVEAYATTVGEVLAGFGAIPQQGPQYAQVNVRLAPKAGILDRLAHFGALPAGMRTRPDDQVAADIRKAIATVPGARMTVSAVRTVATLGADIQIQLRGKNLKDLASTGSQLKALMAQMPGILDPDMTWRPGKPELQVRIDRDRARALGIAPAQAGAALRDAIEGNSDNKLRERNSEVPIRVVLAEIDRNDREDVARIPVAFSGSRGVTLGQVADFRMDAGPAAIDRVNGMRMITVTANLAPGYPLGNAENDIRARLADVPTASQGIEVHFGGESEAMDQNIPYFILALGLAIVLVYLVMASLFNSMLNPFVIMFTLPMALAGGLAALALTHATLSLVAMIGVIMLVGLMGRNAILLIDYTSTLLSRGIPRDEAVAQAGATRLRPILMTTLATIAGMLPVAFRIGRASELRAPMAIVVIGGLLVSTVLTLIVIPSLYTVFDDWRGKVGRG